MCKTQTKITLNWTKVMVFTCTILLFLFWWLLCLKKNWASATSYRCRCAEIWMAQIRSVVSNVLWKWHMQFGSGVWNLNADAQCVLQEVLHISVGRDISDIKKWCNIDKVKCYSSNIWSVPHFNKIKCQWFENLCPGQKQ